MALPQGKRADLLIREDSPFNAGPSPEQLNAGVITPTDRFFVRNHGDIPEILVEDYRLSLGGMVAHPLELSLADLRGFPEHRLISTLQCAGNRRRELVQIAPIPNELEWDQEAISTAEWGGVRLRDVLQAADVLKGAAHVAFLGADRINKHGEIIGLGGSIPLEKALHPDTLLAYAMNGEPLPPTHGFPLRALIPGYIGARSVKWLTQITVQTEQSDNYYQAHAYRLYPASAEPENLDVESGAMLGALPVTSVITSHEPGAALKAGACTVSGYAYAGEREIIRVEVSTDDGRTWRIATLRDHAIPFTWRWWDTSLMLPPGEHTLVVRAWDCSANTQPERVETVWNFKGYMNNAWHRVPVLVPDVITS
jgi:sulfite oxidase